MGCFCKSRRRRRNSSETGNALPADANCVTTGSGGFDFSHAVYSVGDNLIAAEGCIRSSSDHRTATELRDGDNPQVAADFQIGPFTSNTVQSVALIHQKSRVDSRSPTVPNLRELNGPSEKCILERGPSIAALRDSDTELDVTKISKTIVHAWIVHLENIICDMEAQMLGEMLFKVSVIINMLRIEYSDILAFLTNEPEGGEECISGSRDLIGLHHDFMPLFSAFSDQQLADILGDARSIMELACTGLPEEELEELISTVHTSKKRFESASIVDCIDRWEMFMTVVSIFDMRERFAYEISPAVLVSERTLRLWQAHLDEAIISLAAKPRGTGSLLRLSSLLTTREALVDSSDVRHSSSVISLDSSLSRRKKRSWRTSYALVRNKLSINYRQRTYESKASKWIYDTRNNIQLAYRTEADGCIAVKLRSKFVVNFMQLAVILDDVQAYTKWVPFCTAVKTHEQYNPFSYLLSYVADMPWPIKKRETLIYCSAIDAIDELKQIIILAKTPQTSHVCGKEIPQPDANIPRIPDSAMCFFIYPLLENLSGLELQAKVDPGISMRFLKPLIPWVVKNTVVDFLAKIAELASEVDLNGKMLEQKPFYHVLLERGRKCYIDKDSFVNNNEAQNAFNDEDREWYVRSATYKV